MRNFFTFFLCAFGLVTCKDSENERLISGQVINAFTKEPVPNVIIRVLEDGPTVTTDAMGLFQFSDESIGSDEIIVGRNEYALALDHIEYRPRESNIQRNKKALIELAPKDIPAYFYYPPPQLNDQIETGSLKDVNLQEQPIQNLMDKVYRDKYQEIHSLLIYKNGKLVVEEYLFGNNDTINFENNVTVDRRPAPIQWSRKEKHYVASVNKALTSLVVGIAMKQYNVTLSTKISNFLPEYEFFFGDANKGAVDFEDCLTMTAGFQWDEWGDTDLSRLWKTSDFGVFVLSRSNTGPGSEWRYNSALPNLMLKAVDEMVDGDVRTWADAQFYGKLGITDYKWQSQPDGFPEGSARMYLRSRDMLKIGITLLNDGQWLGEQVIPEAWVREISQVKVSTPSSGDYSYHFWIRNLGGIEYLSAEGDGGNYINVFPEHDMVIVITQGLYLLWPLYVTQSDDMMKNYIFPAIQ